MSIFRNPKFEKWEREMVKLTSFGVENELREKERKRECE